MFVCFGGSFNIFDSTFLVMSPQAQAGYDSGTGTGARTQCMAQAQAQAQAQARARRRAATDPGIADRREESRF